MRYLKEINHPKDNEISKESVIPQWLEMSWRIVKNKVDCGVFAIRHMGQLISKWRLGLWKESVIQQTTWQA